MTPDDFHDWGNLAEALCSRTHPETRKDVVAAMRNHLKRQRDVILTDGWTAAVRAHLVPSRGHWGIAGFARTGAAKVLGWSLAVIEGRPQDLPTHEVDVIRAVLARRWRGDRDANLDACEVRHPSLKVLRAPVQERAPAPVAPVPPYVGFVFAWRARGDVPGVTRTGTATAPMVETADADAPVAVRLRRPDGGTLDVRRHGASWLRPVLSPGTWEPVGTADFVRHLREGTPWVDNPTAPVATESGAVQPGGGRVADHRVGTGAAHAVGHLSSGAPATGAREARAMAEAEAACLARAGTLHVIGGVVHRATVEPRLTISGGYAVDDAIHWCLPGDLAYTDEVSTCPGHEPVVRHHVLRRGHDTRAPETGLPVTDATYVRDLAHRLKGRHCRYLGGNGRQDDHEGMVEVLDPSAFRDPVLDALCVAAWAANRSLADMAGLAGYTTPRDVERVERIGRLAERAAVTWETGDREAALATPGLRTVRSPRPGAADVALPLYLLMGAHDAMARALLASEAEPDEDVVAFSH